jgi:alkanesulfonate monooxygenase
MIAFTGMASARVAALEIAWFAALCDDDYEYLGVPSPALESSYAHCRDIVQCADRGGFDNCLLPSGYALGIDSIAFASGVAPLLERMKLLVAIRCGELWPPQLARQLATLDQMLAGRLTINIISSDLPGAPLPSGPRYARTLEVMGLLRQLLEGKPVSHHGEFYDLEIEPPRLRTVSGRCPPFYFGGFSEDAREVAAQAADVYLLWPDRLEAVKEILADLRGRAERHGRRLRFGYRVHVIVRETEDEARSAARSLMSRLDPATGASIRERSLDHASECDARPRYAKPPTPRASWKTLSGPGSGEHAAAAAQPSWATPIRSPQSCAPTRSSESKPSSSRATPMLARPISSPATSCRSFATRPSSSPG